MKNNLDNDLIFHWNINKNDIINFTKCIINKSTKNNNEIINFVITKQNVKILLSLIADDMCICQQLSDMLGFLQHVNTEYGKVINKAALLLHKHEYELNLNEHIYTKLTAMRQYFNQLSVDDIQFINKLIQYYESNGVLLTPTEKKSLSILKNNITNVKNNIIKILYHHNIDKLNDKNIETHYSSINAHIIGPLIQYTILRHKQKRMIGFNENKMIGDDAIQQVLVDMLDKVDDRYRNELQLIRNLSKKDVINNWDIPYYVNMLCEEQNVNEYFELGTTLNKIIGIYENIFNIKFQKINATVWDSNVSTYGIYCNSILQGYVYFDLHDRSDKYKQVRCIILQSGCMYPLSSGKYVVPAIALLASFVGNPILLSFQDVVSIFHEFGHIIHHIFGKTKYIMFSGTNVEIDFVEVPALILELLCYEPHIIKRLSQHHVNNESLSDAVIDKIIKLKNVELGIHYKKHITIALFDKIIKKSKDFASSCEHFQNDDDEFVTYLNGMYCKLFNEIMYDVTINQNNPIPLEWISSLNDIDTEYYCAIWSKIVAFDIYNEKIKGNNINNIGIPLLEHILKHGSTRSAKKMCYDYLERDINLNGFVVMHDLDINVIYDYHEPCINQNNESESNNFCEISDY